MPPLQSTFRALADPTRRDILRLLAERPMTIAEVSDRFDMTRPAVKKHLTVLSDGGLIAVETRGRERLNHLSPDGFRPVIDWLGSFDAFWDGHLAALQSTLHQEKDP